MSVDPRPLVLVDGSNVAFNGTRRASLANLEAVLAALETWPLRVTTLVDATLPHRIDRPRDLESLFHAGRVQQVPAGTSADDFLWQMARAGVAEGRVVLLLTNDRFPDTRSAEEGVLGIHRVTFLVTNGRPFFQPPLESLVSRVPPPPPSAGCRQSTRGSRKPARAWPSLRRGPCRVRTPGIDRSAATPGGRRTPPGPHSARNGEEQRRAQEPGKGEAEGPGRQGTRGEVGRKGGRWSRGR